MEAQPYRAKSALGQPVCVTRKIWVNLDGGPLWQSLKGAGAWVQGFSPIKIVKWVGMKSIITFCTVYLQLNVIVFVQLWCRVMCECSRSSARRPRRGVSCVVHNSQLLLAQVLSRPVLAQSPIIGLSPETSKPRAYILEMSLATNNTWMLMTCCNSFQQGKKEVVIIHLRNMLEWQNVRHDTVAASHVLLKQVACSNSVCTA